MKNIEQAIEKIFKNAYVWLIFAMVATQIGFAAVIIMRLLVEPNIRWGAIGALTLYIIICAGLGYGAFLLIKKVQNTRLFTK